MTQLNWSAEYSVGIDDFDYHHKRIFSLIGELRELVCGEKDLQALQPLLEEFMEYSAYHLAKEEEKFSEYKYENTVEHMDQHNAYRNQLHTFLEQKEDPEMYQKLLEYLESWWSTHILEEDKKYTEFFHEKGYF